MVKTILIIGAGSVQASGIVKAQKMGLKVIALDGDPQAKGLPLADVAIVQDIKDIDGTIALARKYNVDGVMCVAVEAAVRTVAAVGQAMDLAALSPQAAENATNKHRMRTLFDAHGIPSPTSHPCRTLADAQTAVTVIGLPAVVKPADNAGSRGVSKVEDLKDLPSAFENAIRWSPVGLVLAEEFIHGVEMSVEAFVYQGNVHILALSDKIRTEPPWLLDTTVLFPSEQPQDIQDRAKEIVAAAVKALALDMTPVHAEVMVTPEGPSMVELAARGPGFKVFTDMIPWTCGVDVVRELIKIAVGQKPDLAVRSNRGSVLHFPHIPPGRMVKIEGIDKAQQVRGITDLEIYVKPGDIVRPLTSGPDRVGHIIALMETRKDAVESIKEAENILQFEVLP